MGSDMFLTSANTKTSVKTRPRPRASIVRREAEPPHLRGLRWGGSASRRTNINVSIFAIIAGKMALIRRVTGGASAAAAATAGRIMTPTSLEC